jgi:asparagine synthase (glutamine-hydrolysing)
MCGLTGFWGTASNAQAMQHQLHLMMHQIEHRGPDSDGSWVDPDAGIALGHRRLAIVDLSSAGAQPMQSASGRWLLVFNGEIYNHLQLRRDLDEARLSPAWRGRSDTETLLACFDVWGIDATIEKCVGMFAMVIWCCMSHRLILVRDRLGEKPLYYGWQGQSTNRTFLFGSELKALRAHPAFTAQIDRHALAGYMQNMVIAGTQSIYEGIFKVPPGTILTLDRNSSSPLIKRFWSVEHVAMHGLANPFLGSADDAVDALHLLLGDAVAQQMQADVPLGAFLSGGVDSSIITALMQAQSSRTVQTFSIGFEENAYNEADFAKKVAAHLSTDHTELYFTPQHALDYIPRLSSIYDEPFADSSQLSTLLVSQLAKRYVTVALSGDGGDELFGGYNRYHIVSRFWPALGRMPSAVRSAAAWGLNRFSPQALDRLAASFSISKQFASVGDKLHKGAGVLASASVDDLYRGVFAMGWSDPALVVRGLPKYTNPLMMPKIPGMSDVSLMMVFDMLNYLPDDILTKIDRAAMAVSLETRTPFLDHRLVDFAWRLPMQFKLRNQNGEFVTKWALKQVLRKYIPNSLFDRPKLGFGVPLEHWLRGPLRDWAEDLLSEERLKCDGYFHPAPIRHKWSEHLRCQRNHQHALWCVLMFQAWLTEQRAYLVHP